MLSTTGAKDVIKMEKCWHSRRRDKTALPIFSVQIYAGSWICIGVLENTGDDSVLWLTLICWTETSVKPWGQIWVNVKQVRKPQNMGKSCRLDRTIQSSTEVCSTQVFIDPGGGVKVLSWSCLNTFKFSKLKT